MSASRQPQPPQTPVRPSRSIAPLIPGHPEIKLSKPLIGDPQPPANLQFGPCTFPVGAVGNIRKYREIQIQTNVMASTHRSNPGGSRNDILTAYIYSLVFRVQRPITKVETFRDPLDLVNHDNLRRLDEYFLRPLPPPSKELLPIDDEYYVLKDFLVRKKTITIKAGTKIKIITKGSSIRGTSMSNFYYGFSRTVTMEEEVYYNTEYVGTDQFTLVDTAT